MVIRWTSLAQKSLRDIYQFYLPQMGREKALGIVSQIKDEANYLLIFPELGAYEDIKGVEKAYRYIIKNNCKLYYTITSKYIRINPVWGYRT